MEQFPQNTFEQRKDELRKLIELRKEAAIYEDQYDNLFQQVEDYESLIKDSGTESLMNSEKQDYKNKKEKLAAISINVKTIPELRFILEELGKTEEEINETLAHENAHANVSESLGANHETYIVYFLKEGNIYQTRITFPDYLSQEEVNYISAKAIRAPEDYGEAGGMSEDDKKDLGRFNAEDSDLPKGWDTVH